LLPLGEVELVFVFVSLLSRGGLWYLGGGCIWLREELGTPGCICPKILIGGSLCGSPVWTSGLEILLDEGEDVELGARTSKHILLFAFDRFSLYFVHCFILLYHILACVLLQLVLNFTFSF